MMKIKINGAETPKEAITVNTGLNYGRFLGLRTHEYELSIALTAFTALMESEYNKIRDEMQTDDSLYNDNSEFKKTGYCSLPDLLKYETAFENIFKTYLDVLLFVKLFPGNNENKLIINSTESVKANKNFVLIKGKVFEKH